MTDLLKVKILGSGKAATAQRSIVTGLAWLFQETGDYFESNLVSSCLAHYAHYSAVTTAISSDLPILAEKPVCGSLCECDKLINLLRFKPHQHVFPVFQYRFANHAPVEGPEMVTQWKRPLEYWDGWRGLWSTAYGGVLTSHGIHMIDLAITNRGMPDKVSCTLDMMQPGVAVETQSTVGFHYKNSDTLTLTVKAGPDLEQDGFNLGVSLVGYTELYSQIHKTLTKDAPPPVTLEDARNALEVLTAAYYSAYSGKVVTLPIRNDHPFYAGWHEAFAQRVRQQHTPSPDSQKIHG